MQIKHLVLLLLLSVPTFALMLRPGVYTMHDFHLFRQFEFDKCIAARTFPCRWSGDAGLGYGQPLFNFYGQFSYWVGQVFHLLGFSIIGSVKILFLLSLSLSGVAMFYLARTYWGNLGGVISALLYVYAPYRAVDVWVRGALPEALGFVFFPLIWLAVDKFLVSQKHSYLFWLILLTTGLLITHNLSFMMFAPFLGVWIVYRLARSRSRSKLEDLLSASLVVGLLSAFYLLPVIGESHLVTLGSVVKDYYTYQYHFTTLRQLFLSNFWGYGGSIWGPNDGMSFAIGYFQWLVPAISLAGFLIARKFVNHKSLFIILVTLAFGALFLTHGKSEFIWKLLPPLAYIQFPWRFLTVAVFLLSLASGAVAKVVSNKLLLSSSLALLLLLNSGFFRPDIWLDVTDSHYFSGKYWDEMRRSAIADFWPKSAGQLPTEFAPSEPQVVLETAEYQKVQYPIVYFPGWKSQVDLFPSGPLGLVTARVPQGEQIILRFTDTPVRTLGNWVSLVALAGLLIWRWKYVKG